MAASALSACSSATDPGATLKIVDADGVVVVSGLAVGADGRFAGVALTGKAPWTLEACGHAGSDWTCLSSVVQSAGTGNVTPLTDAVLRLAGSASAAGAGTVTDGMCAGLAALLADAGLPADFDFVTGALDAGSRGGCDRLLDDVGVSVGEDGKCFVQISPRLGSGNLYRESGGTAVGALALDPKAAALPLAGLETLFRNMSASLAGAAESTGLRRSMAADARLSMVQGAPMAGPDAVAQALCGYFGSGDDGQSPMWGSTMVSPKLVRCDLSRRPTPVAPGASPATSMWSRSVPRPRCSATGASTARRSSTGTRARSPSSDAVVGTTRSTDDSWIELPEGAEGDAVIRNFYRADAPCRSTCTPTRPARPPSRSTDAAASTSRSPVYRPCGRRCPRCPGPA